MSFKTIYCSCCETKVQAKLTMGDKIYNNSKFKDIPFWKCPTCSNFVSQRKEKTKTGESILVIPTPELRKARMEIHKLMDPLWKNGFLKRGTLYSLLKKNLNLNENFHTVSIRTIEDARIVYKEIIKLIQWLDKTIMNDNNAKKQESWKEVRTSSNWNRFF